MNQLLYKRNYHVLADLVIADEFSPQARTEVIAKLDAIWDTAQKAQTLAT